MEKEKGGGGCPFLEEEGTNEQFGKMILLIFPSGAALVHAALLSNVSPPLLSLWSPLFRHHHRRNVETVGATGEYNTIKTLRNFEGEEILLPSLSLDIILDRVYRSSSDRSSIATISRETTRLLAYRDDDGSETRGESEKPGSRDYLRFLWKRVGWRCSKKHPPRERGGESMRDGMKVN